MRSSPFILSISGNSAKGFHAYTVFALDPASDAFAHGAFVAPLQWLLDQDANMQYGNATRCLHHMTNQTAYRHKILCITGESDRSESALIVGLKNNGLDVTVVCENSCPYIAAFESAGIRIVHRRLKARIDIPGIFFIRKLLKDGGFSLIHAFTGRAVTNGILASTGFKLRKVLYRGTQGHVSRFDPTSWISFLNPSVDAIVCVSKAVQRYLISVRVPQSRLVTIYKGHDPAWYVAYPRERLIQEGVPERAFVVGCTATIRPVKGVDLLLEAVRNISIDIPLVILLVGEIRDDKVIRLLNDPTVAGRVVVLGFRKDAASLMGACDVCITPSREREGLPKSVIEAMILGRPVILTRVGGMPELVSDGQEGLVIEPHSSQAISNAILKMHGSFKDREAMGSRAKARICNDFSINRTIHDTLSLYEKLLS